MDKKLWTNPVFLVSTAVILLLVVLGAFANEQFKSVSDTLFAFTTDNFGWFYLLAVFIITLFLIFISISKYGNIRLGADTDRPEFPFFT